MNQKAVIYIILSAILLYLYYRKGDLAIFAAFGVVVTGTLILGKGGEEGFGMGGGGGGIDKECAKMGFKEVKIDKKDINGSLEKAMRNIEKVADKYWKNGDIDGKITDDIPLSNSWSVIKTYITNVENVSDKDQTMVREIYNTAYELYEKFILQKLTDAAKYTFIKDKILVRLDKDIKNSTSAMDVINKIKNSDEMKDADKDVKNLLKYLVCLFKQWISIFESLKKAMADAGGGGGKNKNKKKKSADDEEGGGGEDDDEKPKKKTKKKSVDEDEDKGEDEDEKPKKKATKKKKKDADDDADDDE